MDSIVLQLLQRQEERLARIEEHLSTSKDVLNLDDVCKLTGLSKSHIYKKTMSCGIPHYKQSKHLFFDRLEIEFWLKQNRIKTTEQIDKESTSYVTLNKKGGAK